MHIQHAGCRGDFAFDNIMFSHDCGTGIRCLTGCLTGLTLMCAAGALMTQAQLLFDKAAGRCCPEQLTSPVLHKVLAYAAIAEHIWGGKGVGSQASCSPEKLFTTMNGQCCIQRSIRANIEY